MPIRVAVVANLEDRRLPEPMEASLYFFVSEALANVVKHARAARRRDPPLHRREDRVVGVCDERSRPAPRPLV